MKQLFALVCACLFGSLMTTQGDFKCAVCGEDCFVRDGATRISYCEKHCDHKASDQFKDALTKEVVCGNCGKIITKGNESP